MLKKSTLLVVVASLAAFVGAFTAPEIAWAQDKQDEKKGPQWKDQAEFDAFDAARKAQATPGPLLEALNKWKSAYPTTEFHAIRQTLFLVAHEGTQRWRDAFDTAKEMLSREPDNHMALRAVLLAILQPSLNPQPADFDFAEQSARHLIANADRIYSEANLKNFPQFNAQAWAQLKGQMPPFAQRTIGYIALTRKQLDKAETEISKAIQMNPNDTSLNIWLGTVLRDQKNPDPKKQSAILFNFARAGHFDGPGSLPVSERQKYVAFFEKAYVGYHGDKSDIDKVIASAKSHPLPPADFIVKSHVDIAKEKAEAEEKERAANPTLTLWRDIKAALTGENPDEYWKKLEGSAVPKFTGKLVSHSPALRPKELIVSIEDPAGDAKLKLEAPLPGKMDPGGTIEFEGVPESYTKSPYQLTFSVPKGQLSGWTGKNTPAAVKPGTKKSAPKKKG